jgi:hypothetical protein
MLQRRILQVGLAVALMAVPATASTFVAMDQAELVAASDAVIQGEVLEVHSFWTKGGTAVVTEARILVEEVVAGQAPSEVVVRTFGGQVGDYRLEAHGFPTFQEGQRLLLFLHTAKDATLQVTGYRLGEYRVARGDRGQMIAMPTLEPGVRLIGRDGLPAPRPEVVPLETLKSQIRGLADRTPARERIK